MSRSLLLPNPPLHLRDDGLELGVAVEARAEARRHPAYSIYIRQFRPPLGGLLRLAPGFVELDEVLRPYCPKTETTAVQRANLSVTQ